MKLHVLFTLLWLGTNAVMAGDIKVAIGLSLPPYVIQESNSGMELDVVKEALADCGHKVVPVYVPFARVPFTMKDGEVDAAITVTEATGIQAAFSDSHITYQNFAISLSKNKFVINQIEDLEKHSVAAFQNAKLYLGDRFKAMANANKRYGERPHQVAQNIQLYNGRADVVVGDRNIFRYYNTEAAKQADVSQPVTFHELFPPTNYKVAFRNTTVRDAFNAALAKMHKDGRYDAIIKKYTTEATPIKAKKS